MELLHPPIPDPATSPPVGRAVDATPRPLPARIPHRGRSVDLEPLHIRHAAELFEAARLDPEGASFAYLAYGPFPTLEAMRGFVAGFAATHDPMAWAIRPHRTGTADGWLTLMQIEPAHAHIELGNIWFSPRLQKTRAATEAMYLLMRHAMEDLGYRRLTWKCNALNAPSIRAARRLGFTYEGTLRDVAVVKGRARSTAWFSILAEEWPAIGQRIAAWLEDSNFDPDGRAKRPLNP
ncbi:MAG: GNAT family protein [Rhodovarius sp.]|nr:GNAT family N-acetyltransferase [Rhodovarius sp.]MCX7933035.1 GNAT family N-acetyltransferase [Rhodovarius sp.]MDW8314249.1 GNAT family protein [Rhodovarius sp.]